MKQNKHVLRALHSPHGKNGTQAERAKIPQPKDMPISCQEPTGLLDIFGNGKPCLSLQRISWDSDILVKQGSLSLSRKLDSGTSAEAEEESTRAGFISPLSYQSLTLKSFTENREKVGCASSFL